MSLDDTRNENASAVTEALSLDDRAKDSASVESGKSEIMTREAWASFLVDEVARTSGWTPESWAEVTSRRPGEYTLADYAACRVSWVANGYTLAALHKVPEEMWDRYLDADRHDDDDALAAACKEIEAVLVPVDDDKPTPVKRARRFIARKMMHAHGPMIRKWRGAYYVWSKSSGCYSEVTDDQLDVLLYRVLALPSQNLVNEVRHALKSQPGVVIDGVQLGEWIDHAPVNAGCYESVPCPNGLLNLRTGTLTPATPRYFTTTTLGVAYDPNAPTPTQWLAFLDQIFDGDQESIECLQEIIGYIVSGDTRLQKKFNLVGPGRSGKGTIGRITGALVGNNSTANPTLASLGERFGMEQLIGKSVAIIGDARLDGRNDLALIAERILSITGEDKQSVECKFRGKRWDGFLGVRFLEISNELARIPDASGVLPKRTILLQTKRSFFGAEDKELTAKLMTELPGILLWAIKGWRRLNERGRFVMPADCQALIDEMVNLGSPALAWIADRCVKGPADTHQVLRADAYRDFKAWCIGEGIDRVPTQAMFGRNVRAAGVEVGRGSETPDGKRPPLFRGIKLAEK